jgi:hypothetical protein
LLSHETYNLEECAAEHLDGNVLGKRWIAQLEAGTSVASGGLWTEGYTEIIDAVNLCMLWDSTNPALTRPGTFCVYICDHQMLIFPHCQAG